MGIRKEKADGGDSDVRSKKQGVLFSAPAEKVFRVDVFGAERVGAQGWAASGHLARVKHKQGQRRERAHPKFKTIIGLACPCPHLPSPLPMPRQ